MQLIKPLKLATIPKSLENPAQQKIFDYRLRGYIWVLGGRVSKGGDVVRLFLSSHLAGACKSVRQPTPMPTVLEDSFIFILSEVAEEI
ncbi:hypothetical protein KY285_027264 [Solanum tuberosum]|nr:hypothetical protein KY289_027472 [Solanum tuberosum]KAH0666058.1 hypothetical protein KY285_027264 [Solanum tuberosum]